MSPARSNTGSSGARKPARTTAARGRSGTGGARGPLELEARRSLADSARAMAQLERRTGAVVAAAAEAVVACLENGGTVFFCGNGGSAADAQHFAAELAGRFFIDRPSLASIALTTNTSSITAIGNDYAFDQVFSRQLESLGTPGDVLVAITTSGGSANVQRAVQAARRLGMIVVGFTGARGAEFAARCDFALITPNTSTPRIQEGHLAMGHALCELVERALFGARPGPAHRAPGGRARAAAVRGGRTASTRGRRTAPRPASRRR